MAEKLDEGVIMRALDWAYENSVSGIPGLGSAEEMAADYMKGEGSLQDKADALIRWQITKAATSGFLTGLPGLPFMPLTVPTNITSVLYVQVRMIAAIAHMGGHDLKDDKVKTMVYVCLCGSAATDVLKDFGIQLGVKLTQQALKNLSGTVITKINQAVGFRLLTKFGSKGLINLGKAIPLVGGVVGGSIDGIATNAIGNFARNTFIGAAVPVSTP